MTLERLEQAMLDEVRALAEEARAADLAAVLAQPQPQPPASASSPPLSPRLEQDNKTLEPGLGQPAARPTSWGEGQFDPSASATASVSDPNRQEASGEQFFARNSTSNVNVNENANMNVSEPTTPSPRHHSQVPPSPSGWSSRSLHSVEFTTDYYKASEHEMALSSFCVNRISRLQHSMRPYRRT